MAKQVNSQTVSISCILSFMAAIAATLAVWSVLRTGNTQFYRSTGWWLLPISVTLFLHLVARLMEIRKFTRWILAIIVPAFFQFLLFFYLVPADPHGVWPPWLIFLEGFFTFAVSSTVVEIAILLFTSRPSKLGKRKGENGKGTQKTEREKTERGRSSLPAIKK